MSEERTLLMAFCVFNGEHVIQERQSVGAGIFCLLRALTTAIRSHSCAGCRN